MKACALKYGKVYDYTIPSFSVINYRLDLYMSHRLSHLATQFAYLSGLESQTCCKRPKLCPDTCLKRRSSGLAGEKNGKLFYGGLVQ